MNSTTRLMMCKRNRRFFLETGRRRFGHRRSCPEATRLPAAWLGALGGGRELYLAWRPHWPG